MSPRPPADLARELQACEARFSRVFDDAPVSLQLIARDGRTLRVNRAWLELWGLSEQDLEPYVYGTYDIFEDPMLRTNGTAELLRRAFAGESFTLPPIHYDPAEIGRPGRARWVRAHIYPIKVANAAVIEEVVLMHDDITESRHAERTLGFLAETSSALLATGLDYQATLDKVAELGMRQLGGWCAVHVIEAGQLALAAVAHREQEKADELSQLWQRSDGLAELDYGPAHVVRTGEPELRRDFADMAQPDRKPAAPAGALREIAGMPAKSYLSIPLREGPLREEGHVVGALTLLSVDRFYTQEDLALARELVDRATLALQNARLYQQARQAIAHHKLLAETMLQGIVRQDASGTIVFMNPAAEHILGKTRDEFLGSSSVDVEHHTLRDDGSPFPGLEHPAMVALRTGRPVRDVVMGVFNPRASAYRWIRIDAVPLFRPGEARPYEVYTVFADISERKQAEQALRESNERLKKVLEVETVGVLFWDLTTGHMTDANDTFLRLMGYSRHEVEAGELTWQRLTPPEYVGASLAEIAKFKTTGRIGPYEKEYFHKDGSRQWLVFAGSSLGGNACVEFCVDISARKCFEAALRQANAELAEADRRKNEFLAVLSHELRNPLAPIANSLYILDRAEPGGEQAERAKQVIGRQVNHLSSLVNDLLDVTRISRNKVQLHRERLELCEVVRRVVEDHRSLFERAGVRVELALATCPVPVFADRTRVAQVVGNLLQNSAKFTSKGGCTRASVEVEGGQAVVRVADDGVGISRETLNRLFQPFTQAAQELDRSKGGLGLGLALVKGLVELHGGTVSAGSRGTGQGAEFVVRLPLDTGTARESPTGTPDLARDRRRVLIIEDNVDAADSLKELLALAHHEVVVAYNGPEGIRKARQLRPDVVFCDIGLPGMDGYDVARAFRADPTLSGAYLVALSGYALPDDVQRATDAGFARHLAKPPQLEVLEEILARPPRDADERVAPTR